MGQSRRVSPDSIRDKVILTTEIFYPFKPVYLSVCFCLLLHFWSLVYTSTFSPTA